MRLGVWSYPDMSLRGFACVRVVLVIALVVACSRPQVSSNTTQVATPALSSASSRVVPPSRVAFVRELGGLCALPELELVIPFYEGLRFLPAAAALTSVKSEYLDLAYPGALSMPLVAWRCGGGTWTAVTTTSSATTPASLLIRVSGLTDPLDLFLHWGNLWARSFVEAG